MSERYEPHKIIKIMYSCRGFRSNQTVNMTVYDSNGVEALAEGAMTELGSTGVYMRRFAPGKQDTYFAVADCAAFPKKDMTQLIVGGKPGEFALGGMVPVGAKILTVRDKDVIIKEIEGVATEIKKIKIVKDNQDKITSKISTLTNNFNSYIKNPIPDKISTQLMKLTKNLEIGSNQNVNTIKSNLKELKSSMENLHKKSLSTIKNRIITDLERKTYKGLNSESIVKLLVNLSRNTKLIGVLADEMSINLKENNINSSSNKVYNLLTTLVPLLDESLILMKKAGDEKLASL